MPELLRQNEDPLNRKAKALLRRAGADAQPNALYVVQLMKWSLDGERDSLRAKFRGDVAVQVDLLLGADPPKAMRWLLQSEMSPNFVRFAASDLDGLSPRQAADRLLESVHGKMQAVLPSYRPRNPD